MDKLFLILLIIPMLSANASNLDDDMWPTYPKAYPLCSKAVLSIAKRMKNIIALSSDGKTIMASGNKYNPWKIYTIDHKPPYKNMYYRYTSRPDFGEYHKVEGISRDEYAFKIYGTRESEVIPVKKASLWVRWFGFKATFDEDPIANTWRSYDRFLRIAAHQKITLTKEEKSHLVDCNRELKPFKILESAEVLKKLGLDLNDQTPLN